MNWLSSPLSTTSILLHTQNAKYDIFHFLSPPMTISILSLFSYIVVTVIESAIQVHGAPLPFVANVQGFAYLQETSWVPLEFISRATINPYRPKTSAKMRINIMPTKSLGCWAVPRTPASPTMPIAKLDIRISMRLCSAYLSGGDVRAVQKSTYPAARPAKPTLRPAPN